MVILSADALNRSDGESIMNYLKLLAENTNVINSAEGWNGINILHTEASRVGILDLGIVPQKSMSKKAKVVYLLGADNFRPEEIPEDAFVIY
jgi:NADH dehydrogenase (ubiquinone) Fe-S protein 1